MSRSWHRKGVNSPINAPNDIMYVKLPNNWSNNFSGHAIIYLHGRGGNFSHMMTNPWQHSQALVDAGFAVVGLDMTGPNAYGHPAALQVVYDTMGYMKNTLKAIGNLGVMAWSMGGLAAANLMVRDSVAPYHIAGVQMWSPLLDLDWAHGAAASGYTAGFTLGSTIPTAAAEINTAYANFGPFTSGNPNGTTTTTSTNGGTLTIPTTAGAAISVPLASVVNIPDRNVGSDARTQTITINGVACNYSGVTQNNGAVTGTLTGVWAAAGGSIIANSTVSMAYATAAVGYDAMKRLADFHSLSIPLQIIHPSDDATVPQAVTPAFLAGANNPRFASVTSITGGHSGSFFQRPAASTVTFFRSLTY